MTIHANKGVLAILFRVEAREGKRQELLEFLRWDSDVARQQEPQTIRFDVLPDPESADAFYVFEAYEDLAAFEAHKGNAPYLRWASPEFQNEILADGGFTKIFEGTPLAVARRPAP